MWKSRLQFMFPPSHHHATTVHRTPARNGGQRGRDCGLRCGLGRLARLTRRRDCTHVQSLRAGSKLDPSATAGRRARPRYRTTDRATSHGSHHPAPIILPPSPAKLRQPRHFSRHPRTTPIPSSAPLQPPANPRAEHNDAPSRPLALKLAHPSPALPGPARAAAVRRHSLCTARPALQLARPAHLAQRATPRPLARPRRTTTPAPDQRGGRVSGLWPGAAA